MSESDAFETEVTQAAAAAGMRSRVFALARTDSAAAIVLAESIEMPWYRCQAFAAVARFAPDVDVETVAGRSLAAAADCGDDYLRAAVAAWPIRALLERDRVAAARAALGIARERAKTAWPASSRAEALILLMRAALAIDAETRESFVEEIAALHGTDGFWRVGRALVDAIGLLALTDPSRPAIGPQPKVFALRAKTDIAGRDGTVLAGASRAARDTDSKRQLPRNESDKLLQPARNRGTTGPSRAAEFAAAIPDPRCRAKALARVAAPPRSFGPPSFE